jgi:CshA-type fibril repeat protein
VGLPPVPTASPEAISDAYDTNQTYTPISNDTPGAASFPLLATTVLLCDTNQTAPNCTLTSLTVDGQGTYTVNPTTGAVVFDPLPTFTGPATPISYQAKDSLNRAVTSAISPTVGLPPVPTATPEAITDAYDTDQVYTPISNDTPGAASFPLLATTVLLCDAGQSAPNCTLTSLTVDGQGTYTVNTTTGEVTFDPLPGFTGPATPISYQASDSLGRTTTSTITPTVDPPDAPVATPETQSVLPGGTATFTTVIGSGGLGTGEDLRSGSVNGPCLVDPSTNLCGTTVTINGEGTWTINRTTGVATFVAENSIAPGDQTPVFYRITDVTGQTATSTLTPTVPPPPNAVNDTSSGDYDTDQLINPLTNDVPGDQSAPWFLRR